MPPLLVISGHCVSGSWFIYLWFNLGNSISKEYWHIYHVISL